jgi:hypothetical protein
VGDARLRELMTDGQSGMATSNDDNINSICHENLDSMSRTSSPLVEATELQSAIVR